MAEGWRLSCGTDGATTTAGSVGAGGGGVLILLPDCAVMLAEKSVARSKRNIFFIDKPVQSSKVAIAQMILPIFGHFLQGKNVYLRSIVCLFC